MGLGNVNVQIRSFSSTANKSAWFNDNPDAAIDYINSLQAGGGTRYSTALDTVMTGFTRRQLTNPFLFRLRRVAQRWLWTSVRRQTTWQDFVTSQGTTSSPSISFGVGIGEATLVSLLPIAFPNTDANADGNEDGAIKVNNPNDLSATLLATVNGGVVLGNVRCSRVAVPPTVCLWARTVASGERGGRWVIYSYTAGGPQT